MTVFLASQNWLAMFIGVILAYFLGALWYHPKVFGSALMAAHGLDPGDCKNAPAIGMVVGFLYHLTLGLLLMFIDSVMPPHGLLLMAFLLALASFLGIGMSVLFPRRPLVLWYINAGYDAVAIIVITLALLII